MSASKDSLKQRPQADEYAVDADRARHVRIDELKLIRTDRVSNQEVFIGRTVAQDVLTSEAKWQVQRITFQAGGDEVKEFAAKGGYNQIWDDRATLFPPFTPGAGVVGAGNRTGIVKSILNSTTTPLAGGASFTGVFEDVTRFAEMSLNTGGAPSNADGTFFFEFSPDGVNVDVSVGIPISGPGQLVPQPLRNVMPFFRIRYVNGSTPQTEFRLTTMYHWTSAKMLTRFLNQVILEDEPVENVRAVIAGKSPNGPFENLPATGGVASNTTSTPLGIGGVFDGVVESTQGFITAAVTVISDVNSATGGLMFQWFKDSAGTILLKGSTFTYGSSPLGINISVPVQGPFFRIKYTNGGVAQTTFQLVLRLAVSPAPPDVVAIDDNITGTNTASVTKAQLVGKREDGVFANVALSNNESINVAINDRPSELRGRVEFHISINNIALVGAPGTTIHTVTAGKTFFLQSFKLVSLNDSSSDGHWNLTDAGTIKDTTPMSSRVAGAPATAASSSPNLPEPIKFATSIRLEEITGVIEVGGFLNGYEETN